MIEHGIYHELKSHLFPQAQVGIYEYISELVLRFQFKSHISFITSQIFTNLFLSA